MLYQFLKSNREEVIARCRAKVAQRNAPRATARELEYGIPAFLAQLTEIVRSESLCSLGNDASGPPENAARPMASLDKSATGSDFDDLWLGQCTVDQVVHDYGALCQTVSEMAAEGNLQLSISEGSALDRYIDNAIAGAVGEFARQRAGALADASEQTMDERLGLLAYEFRHLITTAMLAVAAIEQGTAGISGPTGSILDRTLAGLLDLCDRSFVDVRLKVGLPVLREPVLVSAFIEEIRVSAAINAKARDIELIVPDVEPGLALNVDRQILAGAVANLLHNAFKFTRSHGRVSLTTFSSTDRVFIEVQDQCGGLPVRNAEDTLRPFEQRHRDRSGSSLGLSISRRGIETNGGKLHVRDLPGSGCVFTIDLPKSASVAPQGKVA